MIPLQMLPPGQEAEIKQVLGSPEQTHRLHELGLQPGKLLHMVQSGDPCIVRIGGAKFCFRFDQAVCIMVESRSQVPTRLSA